MDYLIKGFSACINNSTNKIVLIPRNNGIVTSQGAVYDVEGADICAIDGVSYKELTDSLYIPDLLDDASKEYFIYRCNKALPEGKAQLSVKGYDEMWRVLSGEFCLDQLFTLIDEAVMGWREVEVKQLCVELEVDIEFMTDKQAVAAAEGAMGWRNSKAFHDSYIIDGKTIILYSE